MAEDYNTVSDAWDEFERSCLSEAPPFQIKEMKKSFYMGAASVLGLMYRVAAEDDLSEEATSALFFSWREECDMYVAGIVSDVTSCSGGHNA